MIALYCHCAPYFTMHHLIVTGTPMGPSIDEGRAGEHRGQRRVGHEACGKVQNTGWRLALGGLTRARVKDGGAGAASGEDAGAGAVHWRVCPASLGASAPPHLRRTSAIAQQAQEGWKL